MEIRHPIESGNSKAGVSRTAPKAESLGTSTTALRLVPATSPLSRLVESRPDELSRLLFQRSWY
jgi:hypothetical protein